VILSIDLSSREVSVYQLDDDNGMFARRARRLLEQHDGYAASVRIAA